MDANRTQAILISLSVDGELAVVAEALGWNVRFMNWRNLLADAHDPGIGAAVAGNGHAADNLTGGFCSVW